MNRFLLLRTLQKYGARIYILTSTSGVVGETNFESVAGKLMGVRESENQISSDAGGYDLGTDVFVRLISLVKEQNRLYTDTKIDFRN